MAQCMDAISPHIIFQSLLSIACVCACKSGSCYGVTIPLVRLNSQF